MRKEIRNWREFVLASLEMAIGFCAAGLFMELLKYLKTLY
jgi:hypothetical protein